MDQHLIPSVTYTIDGQRKLGIKIWRKIFKDLRENRLLLQQLIARDIAVRFRQSVLGYVWAVVPQIVTAAIFTYLAQHRIVSIGETPGPYVVFALWNLSVWQLFSSCLANSTQSLITAGSLVSKVNFPKEILILSSAGVPLFDFLIRLIPVSAGMIFFDVSLPVTALATPFLLMPVILLALGIGFFLSIGNLVFRDVGNALGTVLSFALFLAPILYPPPQESPFSLTIFLNPFSPFIIATQDILFRGYLTLPELWGAYSGLSIIMFFAGWRMFRLILPKIAERA